MINQIKKNSKDIQQFLIDIEKIDLFRNPPMNQDGSLCQFKVKRFNFKKQNY